MFTTSTKFILIYLNEAYYSVELFIIQFLNLFAEKLMSATVIAGFSPLDFYDFIKIVWSPTELSNNSGRRVKEISTRVQKNYLQPL